MQQTSRMVLVGISTKLRLTKIKEGRRNEEWEEHLKNGVGGKISHAEVDKDKGREEEKRVGKHLKNGVGGKINHVEVNKDKGREEE